MHLNHQNDTRRIRLDLTVSAAKHHQNHFTTISFRRSSETVEPPPKPSHRRREAEVAFTPRELEPATAKLKKTFTSRPAATDLWKPPSPGNETYTTSVLTTPSTPKQPHFHFKNRNTTGGDEPELRQNGKHEEDKSRPK
ncbi:LOW QUALITY PROTEIN: hypothetical protein YC2023_064856 [Brassica napus]